MVMIVKLTGSFTSSHPSSMVRATASNSCDGTLYSFRVEDVRFDRPAGEMEIDVGAQREGSTCFIFPNVEVRIAGELVYEETGAISARGSFFSTNTLTVPFEPTGSATEIEVRVFLEPDLGDAFLTWPELFPQPLVEDVVVDCDVSPRSLRAGEEVSVEAELENVTDGSFTVAGEVRFGGVAESFEEALSPGTPREVGGVFVPVEDGAVTPEIELSVVG